jgi:hypothetical protein
MISGDHNILQTPVNLAAYTASGLISIWPPAGYPQLKRFGQAAFLVRWWPVIKMKIAASKVGSPCSMRTSYSASPRSRAGLAMATRNVSDFTPTGVAVVNPFELLWNEPGLPQDIEGKAG